MSVMKMFVKTVVLAMLIMPAFNGYGQNYSPPLAKGEEKFTNKARLLRGPYLQAATDTSMIIRWRTDAATRSRVWYGTAPGTVERSVEDLETVTDHIVKLTGLKPGTRYYYAIGTLKDTLQYGPDNYFSTLPAPGVAGNYRIGVFGDCGSLSVNQVRARDQFLQYLGGQDINAWILLGDNAYNDGNDMEYQAKFFNPYREMLKKFPVYPSPGNHDYHDADFGAEYAQTTHSTPYYQNFSMPVDGEGGGVPSGNPAFYSFDLGNIHFISLDSYGIEENKYFLYDTLGPQVQWLKKDLEQNRNRGWVIAFWHYPPYSKGTHDSDTDGIMTHIRQNVISILERNKVDLILCGHSHVYERSRMMKGHFGPSSSFDAAKHNLSTSSGSYAGTKPAAPYIKQADKGEGVVYVVSGSSSYVGKSYYDFPHKAMYYSNDSVAGAAILEINDNRLDFKWICTDGVIRDQFTMMKDVNRKTTVQVKKGEKVKLTASFMTDTYRWSKGGSTERTVEVTPTAGKTIYTVTDPYNYLKDTFEVILLK